MPSGQEHYSIYRDKTSERDEDGQSEHAHTPNGRRAGEPMGCNTKVEQDLPDSSSVVTRVPPAAPGRAAAQPPDEDPNDPGILELHYSSKETEMGIKTCREGAEYLASQIYKLLGRDPAPGALEEGARELLPLVANNRKHWDRLRGRVLFACESSKDHPIQKSDGGSFTWYEALIRSRDPVKTFVKNRDLIAAKARLWAEAEDRKEKAQKERTDGGTVFTDGRTELAAVFEAAAHRPATI